MQGPVITMASEFNPQPFEPPPAYSERDKGNVIIASESSGNGGSQCMDRWPLNAGCQVFGWFNILLHSTLLSVCIYGYALLAQHAAKGKMPVQIKIVMISIWIIACFAILANVLLLIGVYRKNILCIKAFVVIYGIYVSLVSFGLFKQSLLMQMDSKQFYETLLGILLAIISLVFGHCYYLKLKKEKTNQPVIKASTYAQSQDGAV